jgi:hypothetical protein
MQNETITSPLHSASSHKEGTIFRWQPLEVPISATFSCESCGFPGWACSRCYWVPGLAGRFHAIRCVECVLFGPGRCRWCGAKLDDRGGRRFCSDACARRSNATLFGNGQRLLSYLRRHQPNVYHQIAGSALSEPGTQGRAAEGACLGCQGSLNGRRADAQFCSPRCKTRYHRSLAKTQNTPISRNADTTESITYNQEKAGVGLEHGGGRGTRL